MGQCGCRTTYTAKLNYTLQGGSNTWYSQGLLHVLTKVLEVLDGNASS